MFQLLLKSLTLRCKQLSNTIISGNTIDNATNRHITATKFPSLRPKNADHYYVKVHLINNIISMSSDLPNSIMIRCVCFSYTFVISAIFPDLGRPHSFQILCQKDRFITYWSHDVIPSGNITTGTNTPY